MIQYIRFAIGRQLIHLGLAIFPPGWVKADLTDLLLKWGHYVRETIASNGENTNASS
jgi:hypothetical protein